MHHVALCSRITLDDAHPQIRITKEHANVYQLSIIIVHSQSKRQVVSLQSRSQVGWADLGLLYRSVVIYSIRRCVLQHARIELNTSHSKKSSSDCPWSLGMLLPARPRPKENSLGQHESEMATSENAGARL